MFAGGLILHSKFGSGDHPCMKNNREELGRTPSSPLLKSEQEVNSRNAKDIPVMTGHEKQNTTLP